LVLNVRIQFDDIELVWVEISLYEYL